jgi:hypothetical protein
MRNVSQVITDALNALNEVGWCQGTGQTPDGRICMGAAMIRGRDIAGLIYINPASSNWATYNACMNDWEKSQTLVMDTIWSLFPERVTEGGIPGFNDHPQTTLEDVKLVLKTALEAANAPAVR